MTTRSETDVVLEHALQDETNLHIALLIGAAYDTLCERVVTTFFDVVEKDLTTRLGPNWQLIPCREPSNPAYKPGVYTLAKFSGHPANFDVMLAADEAHYPKSP